MLLGFPLHHASMRGEEGLSSQTGQEGWPAVSPGMVWAPQEPRVRASPTWNRQGVRTQAVGDHQLIPGCEAGMRAGLTCGGFTCAQEDSGGAAWSRTSCLEPQSLDTRCGWPWISL